MPERTKHKAEDLKGRLKEGLGDVTDDPGLKREGKVDRGKAATKDTVDKVGDAVKDAVNPKRR
jgi:uncharacterized protein YjbJ (UPF0337 family)